MKAWVLIRDPGKVPQRKGPFRDGQPLARFIREAMRARPHSFLTVVRANDDGDIDVEDGPEALWMLDFRSVSTAKAHCKRLRERYPAGGAASDSERGAP